MNGRVRDGLSDENACAAACSELDNCIGYAYAFGGSATGRCYLHGPALDDGLTVFENGPALEWEGYVKSNVRIGAASGYSGAVCKTGAFPCLPIIH